MLKSNTLQNYLPQAGANGAKVIPGVRVSRISSGGSGSYTVNGVSNVAGNASRVTFSAEHLVIAGGPINTPHLLKKSGLGKNVGHNLKFHMNLKVTAVFKDEINAHDGTIFTAQVQEFEREGLYMMASTLLPHLLVTTAGHFGNSTINHLLENYSRTAIYVAMIKPRSSGKINSYAGSSPVVRYRFDPEDGPQIQSALLRMSALLLEAGAEEIYLPLRDSKAARSIDEVNRELASLDHKRVEIVSVHGMSSVPMGGRAEQSAVRPDGSLWEESNILVTDASMLPTSTGVSPQGTIMAMAREALSRQSNITVD